MNKHEEFIANLKVGDLIAFKLFDKDAKMYSGIITVLGVTRLEVQTKNGKKYYIEKTNVQWVNTNGRWPRFVMNAFKGVDTEEKSDVLKAFEASLNSDTSEEEKTNTDDSEAPEGDAELEGQISIDEIKVENSEESVEEEEWLGENAENAENSVNIEELSDSSEE